MLFSPCPPLDELVWSASRASFIFAMCCFSRSRDWRRLDYQGSGSHPYRTMNILRSSSLALLSLLVLAAAGCSNDDGGTEGDGGDGGSTTTDTTDTGDTDGDEGSTTDTTDSGDTDPGAPSGSVDPDFPFTPSSFLPVQIEDVGDRLVFGAEYLYSGGISGDVLGNRFVRTDAGAIGIHEPYTIYEESLFVCTFDAALALESCAELPDSTYNRVIDILPRAGGATVVVEIGCNGCSIPSQLGLAHLDESGALDTSFGDAGWLTVTNGLDEGLEPVDAARLADGRIVVSATTSPGYAPRLMILSEDGVVDTTFGQDGVDQTAGSGPVTAHPDGGFLVASQYNGNFAISRYTADGELDTTFGQGGRVDAEALAGAEFADDYSTRAILVAKSGAIYVGAGRKYDDVETPIVLKLDGTGVLVGSFGQGGIARVLGAAGATWVHALAEDQDGRIVAGIYGEGGEDGVVRLVP